MDESPYRIYGRTLFEELKVAGCDKLEDLSLSLSGWFFRVTLHDWRFTANQFVLAKSPLRPTSRAIFQLNTCGYSPYVTSSLMRGWVCHLQLLLSLVSAVILRSESHGTHDHILLSQIQNFQKLEGQVPVFISPRTRVARLYPQALGFHFRRLLRLAGLRWRYLNPPSHGIGCFF
jgi:hypothetical protein